MVSSQIYEFGKSMDNPWTIHGLSMDNPWIIHGLSMDRPWIAHGLAMDYPWISVQGSISLFSEIPGQGPFFLIAPFS